MEEDSDISDPRDDIFADQDMIDEMDEYHNSVIIDDDPDPELLPEEEYGPSSLDDLGPSLLDDDDD
jgi:hypothetical protein